MNIAAEIFHDGIITASQHLNCIQESEYTNQFLLHFHIVVCYYPTNGKPDLFLSDNCMSGLCIFKTWRVNKNIVVYKKPLSKLKVSAAMSDWRNDTLKK